MSVRLGLVSLQSSYEFNCENVVNFGGAGLSNYPAYTIKTITFSYLICPMYFDNGFSYLHLLYLIEVP